MRSIEAVRRRLRGLAAVAGNPGATEHERATAAALKTRLKQRLEATGAPAGDWTDGAFRLGRWARKIGKPATPASPTSDWTDNAFRLGKAVRRGLKRWSSD